MRSRVLLSIFKLCAMFIYQGSYILLVALLNVFLVPFIVFHMTIKGMAQDFRSEYRYLFRGLVRDISLGVYNFKIEIELLMRGK
jgi:hypothetical protein